ncbi:Delta-aminolevulinic acid dehydratase [Candidatus Neptunochlamydia vexilliferae]|uniref:Delta-aminolevulinic acid dehydratase n=2 Tax=Candidatus Neptunichlamydia vexilliferae TaxID=1651774 RepID=A0ABS0B0J1_9BACT|nr:Delta-aminolevulinic acid dehydratase [Candidatus Neptunochlamydia vexilliferae]
MLLMQTKRPRRNRKSPAVRSLVQETTLNASDLIAPFFIMEGTQKRDSIEALPGIDRLSIDLLVKEAEPLHAQGVPAIALFPVIDPSLKDHEGSEAWNPNSLVVRAIECLKKEIPSLCIISDIALDPFTSHGHDGIVNDRGDILNDATVDALVKQATSYAQAGCDIVAPSDMMDGRIGAIRKTLDNQGLDQTSILSYTVKYASSFYGPFRNALKTSLTFGDKKTYQMDPSNRREAVRELLLDEEEGADMVMVKPALPYLDVIVKLKEKTSLPVGAYQVSGEYAMIMAAHEKGYLDAQSTLFESLTSIKRAGADFIFTYAASQILGLLN